MSSNGSRGGLAMGEILTAEQFLTFALATETYALAVGHVREVLEMSTITPLPRTPEYMRGVINVRGSVVPVIDLRLKLGMTRTEKSIDTCVVVLDVPTPEGAVTVGALVDSVQEVVEFDASRIEPPPRLGTAVQAEFLRGIGKRDERFVVILEIGRIFEAEELEVLGAAETAPVAS
jgi:purine-binding chemotaxis protein CheW